MTIGRKNLKWLRDGQAWVVSHGAFMARVEPDEQYHSMWRVRGPDGKLSDFLNLPRAKDAAAALAMVILNGREAPARRRPARQSRRAAPGRGSRKSSPAAAVGVSA
jgi:hypothetical protein